MIDSSGFIFFFLSFNFRCFSWNTFPKFQLYFPKITRGKFSKIYSYIYIIITCKLMKTYFRYSSSDSMIFQILTIFFFVGGCGAWKSPLWDKAGRALYSPQILTIIKRKNISNYATYSNQSTHSILYFFVTEGRISVKSRTLWSRLRYPRVRLVQNKKLVSVVLSCSVPSFTDIVFY